MKIKQEKPKIFDASRFKVGVVVSCFNKGITDKLLASALAALRQHKVREKNIRVVRVAGSVEIPYALQKLAQTKKYDCLISLGAVIKGETDHYTYVCKMSQEGILRVMLDYSIPVGFGVLMTSDLAQAEARTDNGALAVRAALELANLEV